MCFGEIALQVQNHIKSTKKEWFSVTLKTSQDAGQHWPGAGRLLPAPARLGPTSARLQPATVGFKPAMAKPTQAGPVNKEQDSQEDP